MLVAVLRDAKGDWHAFETLEFVSIIEVPDDYEDTDVVRLLDDGKPKVVIANLGSLVERLSKNVLLRNLFKGAVANGGQ